MTSKYRYVLVVLDIFSRYMFLRPLTSKSAVEVCHHLECIFCEHEAPTIIQTDQGTEFKGMFDELCSKRNIRHIRSRAYHPESQGKSWKNKMVYDMLINGNTNWVTNLFLYSETSNQSKHRGLGYDELKKVDNENHIMKNFGDTSDEVRFEMPFFYPETSDELQARQYKEMRKKCVACDPAVPNNGGAVTEGNLRFIFVVTCTLDYFLSFMRLTFLTNNSFRYFLESAAQRENIVAQTLLEMEPSLHKLDWNMARFVWSKMIGVVDKALKQQHRSEKNTFGYLKVRVR
ncbi:unnamed protein product [Rotaria sordida]|uniref:Integrase catalytic domain-containing protein n=1 Tax=Rotaria sordida TaxID=392033 RepID=A0A819G7I2_9BILA|nr:unnamed protein product [Rotaria sordida]CAF3877122.1 unnamed protein product [Rotaria sordida]